MVRLKAASLHFLVSALVLLLVFAWLRVTWYPQFLFDKMGAAELFVMMLVVDVFLGPLCTLAVYNPHKASLRFDMAVVIALQLSALCYGVFTLWEGRPAYLVFNVDRLTVVTAAELDSPDASDGVAAQRWYPLPQLGPRLAAAFSPEDPEERSNLMLGSAFGGRDLPQLPKYFVPFDQAAGQIAGALRDLSELDLARNKKVLQQLLSVNHLAVEAVGYLPVEAKQEDFIAVINKKDGHLLGYLDVAPLWSDSASR